MNKRDYVIGLPVVVTVYDNGKVTYEVDTSDASLEIGESDHEYTSEEVDEDIERIDAARGNWRTLALNGQVSTFATRELAEAAGQDRANRTRTSVGIEEWSPDHPQDPLNRGWACVGFVEPQEN